jgi:cyclophilin family peptidyl-prolyl cis-trans isomerase
MKFTRLAVALVLVTGSLFAGTLVQFRTVFGDVEVELLDKDKPVTVQNFLRYVNEGAYQDSFFHRVVPNFVMQGGGFFATNRGKTNASVDSIPVHAAITNEINVGQFVSNTPGTIAMAKSADPNSATSQFFFNLVDNSKSLDNTNNSGGFTVFGRVVGGTNAFALYNSFVGQRTPQTNIIINFGGVFAEVPVLAYDPNAQFFDLTNLVYVDVTTMNVHVAKLDSGFAEITWNSATQATNVVEYTTNFPPAWLTLTNIVRPRPGTNSVVDTSADRSRFYRVRTAY